MLRAVNKDEPNTTAPAVGAATVDHFSLPRYPNTGMKLNEQDYLAHTIYSETSCLEAY